MSTRHFIVRALFNLFCIAYAKDLFARITVSRRDANNPVCSFGDYVVKVDEAGMAGVKLLRQVG